MVRGGRRQMHRPWFRVAIQPRRLHAGTRCADDIEMRVIADVQHLRRLDTGLIEQST